MYNIFGIRDGSEFKVDLNDWDSDSKTCAHMSMDVFAELIMRNVDKIVSFDIVIDDEVEYVKVDGDPCLMKPEVTD